MNKWTYFFICLCLGSATAFGAKLVASGESKSSSGPVVSNKPSKASHSQNNNIQQIHMMMRVQQYQQAQDKLKKMYQEKQNILAALDTIERNKAKPQQLQNPLVMKGAFQQQKLMKDRLATLTKDIAQTEKYLKNYKIK